MLSVRIFYCRQGLYRDSQDSSYAYFYILQCNAALIKRNSCINDFAWIHVTRKIRITYLTSAIPAKVILDSSDKLKSSFAILYTWATTVRTFIRFHWITLRVLMISNCPDFLLKSYTKQNQSHKCKQFYKVLT